MTARDSVNNGAVGSGAGNQEPGGDVVKLIGVYHADGGPIGEAKYVIGKLLGINHCSLCDVTHSPVRRKPAWDAMVQRLGLPVTLLHLNEMPRDVTALVQAHGSPLVLARTASGSLAVLLDGAQLESLDGSVDAFESAVRGSLGRGGNGRSSHRSGGAPYI